MGWVSHEGQDECDHKFKPTEEDLRWWCLCGRFEGRGCMRSSCGPSTGNAGAGSESGAGSAKGGVCEKSPCIAPKNPPVVETYSNE